MGLIYSSSDSEVIKSSLATNLSIARTAVSNLNSGSQQLIAAIDGQTLAGAAYTAGKGLFSELVIPTIKRVSSAVDNVQRDLNTFSSADSFIASEGYLEEDNLNEQLTLCKSSKTALENAERTANMIANALPEPLLSEMIRGMQRDFARRAQDCQKDIQRIEKKLNKLREFNGKISGLFQGSLAEFKLAMQGIMVLNGTTIHADGSYTLPEGTSKEWFTKIQGIESLEEAKKNQQNMAKMINDLFKKNPAAAIEKVKKDKRLFNYIITALDSDKVPEKLKMAALKIFIFQENVNDWPKEKALKVLRSSELAILVEKLPLDKQAQLYGVLIKLSEKGWEVLAPMGHLTGVLSKSSLGSRIIAGSKVGLAEFKKLKAVSDFLKAHPVLKEGVSVGGDVVSVASYAYEEYTDPKSPAYGDASKAIYGGLNIFFLNVGPLEGAQYGGPAGAIAGMLNTIFQGIELQTPFKWLGKDGKIGWDGIMGIGTQEDADKWLEEQYAFYESRKKNLNEGNISEIKEDWLGKQDGRVNIEDFNNGLPRW